MSRHLRQIIAQGGLPAPYSDPVNIDGLKPVSLITHSGSQACGFWFTGEIAGSGIFGPICRSNGDVYFLPLVYPETIYPLESSLFASCTQLTVMSGTPNVAFIPAADITVEIVCEGP
jgi:hypothetical protein